MNIIQRSLTGLMIASLTACQLVKTQPLSSVKPMNIQIYQKWELQRGDRLDDRTVVSALGELAIDMAGKPIYAPMNGEANLDPSGCVLFAGTELPAYLFRFCGVSTPKIGVLRKGQAIGTTKLLVFATLQRQQNGSWAFIEPSKVIVEQTLKPS